MALFDTQFPFENPFSRSFGPVPTPRFGNQVRLRQPTSFFDPNLLGGPEPFANNAFNSFPGVPSEQAQEIRGLNQPSRFRRSEQAQEIRDLNRPGGPFGDDQDNLGNINADFLTDPINRGGIFRNALNQANLSPNQTDFFKRRREDIIRQYESTRANAANAGRNLNSVPEFNEFIGGFDFQREFQNATPQQRGFTGSLNRGVRFLN